MVIILHAAAVFPCLSLALACPPARLVHQSGCPGILSEEAATAPLVVLYFSVADKPVNVNFLQVERMSLIGINVLIEWELHLQMCNTQCDVVFTSLWKGIWWLEWQLLNSATASRVELLCARFPHFYWRKDNLIVENYTEIPSKRWGHWRCYPCIHLTGFPVLPGENKCNNNRSFRYCCQEVSDHRVNQVSCNLWSLRTLY